MNRQRAYDNAAALIGSLAEHGRNRRDLADMEAWVESGEVSGILARVGVWCSHINAETSARKVRVNALQALKDSIGVR